MRDNRDREYDLDKSVSVLGRLNPIIKAADGEILDGYHRKEMDPNWEKDFSVTLPHIKTKADKILSKIAANVCRRAVPAEEKTQWLRDLVETTGWDAKTIAAKSGMSQAWVWKYLPEELKTPRRVAAGKKGGRVQQVPQEPLEMQKREVCFNCGLGAIFPKPVPHPDTGKTVMLCMDCGKLWEDGALTLQKPKAVPAPQKQAFRKPSIERWEDRLARRSSPIAKIQDRVAARLQDMGIKVETEKTVCLEITRIDIYCSELDFPIYLDGPPHKKEVQRLKDERKSQLYLKRYGRLPLRIDYEGTSQKEEDRIVNVILQELQQVDGWVKGLDS